jgi:hypothetical protein
MILMMQVLMDIIINEEIIMDLKEVNLLIQTDDFSQMHIL